MTFKKTKRQNKSDPRGRVACQISSKYFLFYLLDLAFQVDPLDNFNLFSSVICVNKLRYLSVCSGRFFVHCIYNLSQMAAVKITWDALL